MAARESSHCFYYVFLIAYLITKNRIANKTNTNQGVVFLSGIFPWITEQDSQ